MIVICNACYFCMILHIAIYFLFLLFYCITLIELYYNLFMQFSVNKTWVNSSLGYLDIALNILVRVCQCTHAYFYFGAISRDNISGTWACMNMFTLYR